MYKLKRVLKKLFTPVTIMLVPHDSKRPIRLRIPSLSIALATFVWLAGTVYIISIAVQTFEYYRMQEKLSYYKKQFLEVKTSIISLQRAEDELKRILSFKSKEKILENLNTPSTTDQSHAKELRKNTQGTHIPEAGSLNLDLLKEQMATSMERIDDMKKYLETQKDIFMTTPHGWPVIGRVTSGYGERESPTGKGREFHSGIDIGAEAGTPVRATAEGVVKYAGFSPGSGNLVVVEHGLGYATFYGHNKKLRVTAGQKVGRGDIVAFVGSTGNSTGPHLHYEVWKQGRAVNPRPFIEEAAYVSKEKR